MLNRSGQAEPNIGSMGTVLKLPSFDEKIDDFDAYLYRFEGYATMQGWPKERWASYLTYCRCFIGCHWMTALTTNY